MPLAMAGRARNDGLVLGHAGGLAVVGVGVVFGVEGNDRRAAAVCGEEGDREAGDTALDRESAPLQQASHQRRRLMRSEEHTSELQSLMRSSYAVSCVKKKKKQQRTTITQNDYIT